MANKLTLHPSITTDRIIAAVKRSHRSLENPGICIACGEDAYGCDPDARAMRCESCGQRKVFGAEELLFV